MEDSAALALAQSLSALTGEFSPSPGSQTHHNSRMAWKRVQTPRRYTNLRADRICARPAEHPSPYNAVHAKCPPRAIFRGFVSVSGRAVRIRGRVASAHSTAAVGKANRRGEGYIRQGVGRC
ncbi:uncharacterized protein SCHCODRAFT_02640327 [Schizophyllum commune H4-8]|uniref:uncharacterized protein n=1 Tax=Schizophyllum commune (strain H4-8 / FGSC 9210) TaxID=578458 RepID=UPI00215FB06C|nr:uncharacterized protein SCHCODRAFT_02640327 [Schizophyllum commune H4-8]KAI5886927.1 hypothetical protein SCHCODRAFT_02640327 [Schizophyllum commune H4-8]